MYQPTYKSRVLSPIQPRVHPAEKMRRKALDTQDSTHPIRREIQRMCGEYQFSARFSEDTEALKIFPHVAGLVAVKCLLSKDGKSLAEGRGYAILTRINKSIERTALVCVNASFLSACNNACKIWDSLRLEAAALVGPKDLGEAYKKPDEEVSELASDRQKSYLQQLICLNVEEEVEKERMLSQIDQLTRSEASEAIQVLAGGR